MLEWYPLYFAFQSALTILLSIVWEPHHPAADHWRAVLRSTALWFRKMTSLGSLGDSYARILESVVSTTGPSAVEDTEPLADVVRFVSSLGDEEPSQAIDVERYWLEIMGNELALPNLNQDGWWDQFIQSPSR